MNNHHGEYNIYNATGFGWLRNKPLVQIVLGLLSGFCALGLMLAGISINMTMMDFMLLFVEIPAPLFICIAAAVASLVIGATIFVFLLFLFIWLWYEFFGNGLHLLWPAAAHRFRGLALAFAAAWVLEAIFHTVLFVLFATDIGSHVFVIFYTGTGLEFLYGFVIGPWFFILVLCVFYPLVEMRCSQSGSHNRATAKALDKNGVQRPVQF